MQTTMLNTNYIFIALFLFSIKLSFAQIPINEYRKEIENLKTDNDFQIYWDNLNKIDQEILVTLDDSKKSDSLSIDNMIRTALVFEIHGEKAYKPNNVVPILNMSHNSNGNSQIAFWSIIKKCAKIGGIIENFGGKYPAYQLEGIGLTFYHYSFLNQESKYPKLIKKMDSLTNNKVVMNLNNAFEQQKKSYKLKEIEVLNEWYIQPFTNLKEKDKFAFIIMSDNEVYLKKFKNVQKLSLIKKENKSKIYRIENEPFGWTYEYGNDGSLCLKDENENKLIQYTKYK